MKRFFMSLVFILVIVMPTRAQYYLTGEDPSRLHWRQLNTGPIRLIYPSGMDSLAFRYAWLMEKVGPQVLQPLGASFPSVPVVLHPYNLNSNGLVVWAPKRVELRTTPPPLYGNTQNWEKQLALHEMRHLGQMQRSGERFFKPLSWLIGEQSEGLSVGLFFGKWLLEGDATLWETRLSNAGRGREASFLMPYRAYFADSIDFPKEKWFFGSYKHVIPNVYINGYFRLSVAQGQSAAEAMDKVFSDVTARPYWPFAYAQSFKTHLGHTPYQLWDAAKAYYQPLWDKMQTDRDALTVDGELTLAGKDYVSYRSPVEVITPEGASLIYAIKTSLSQTPTLVSLSADGKEKRRLKLGDINSQLSVGGGNLCWSETVSGLRWAHENYSIVWIYNTTEGSVRVLKNGTRFFNPALSEDGTQVALAYYPPQGGSEFLLLDVQTAEVMYRYVVPKGEQLTQIQWAGERQWAVSLTGEEGKRICLFSLESDRMQTRELRPARFSALYELRVADGQVFFRSDANGIDNIHSLSLSDSTQAERQLSRVRFGAFDPFFSQKQHRLYFSDYSVTGYQVKWMELSDRHYLPVQPDSSKEDLLLPQGFTIDTIRVPDTLSYLTRPYRKAAQHFRLHSWMPFYFNYNELDKLSFQTYYEVVSLGATVFSQNTLGTSWSQWGYRYQNGFHSGHLKYTFSGWYPVISLEGSVNTRFATHTRLAMDEGAPRSFTDTLEQPLWTLGVSTYVPFTFNRRGRNSGLIPSLRYQYSSDRYSLSNPSTSVAKQYLQLGIQYYSIASKAQRAIFPRGGIGFKGQYATAVAAHSHFSSMWMAQLYGYIPGFGRNQALKWDVEYQHQQVASPSYYLGTLITPLRGFSANVYAPKVAKGTLDYAVPIWVGDPVIAPLLYVKRLQVIPFAQGLWAGDMVNKFSFTASYGVDILADFHVFRIGAMISAGVRYIRTSDNRNLVEALFSLPAF